MSALRVAPAVSVRHPELFRSPDFERRTGRLLSRRTLLGGALGLLLLGNVLLISRAPVAPLTVIVGFTCVIGLPTGLLCLLNPNRALGAAERLLTSMILAIGLLCVAALASDLLLPVAGIRRPLDRAPVLAVVDLLVLALGVAVHRRGPALIEIRPPRWGRRDRVLVFAGLGVVLMSVGGAIRLNNGAGGGLTLAMLIVVLGTLALAVAWRDRVGRHTLETTIYLISLALLLMTSMRGWYTTGHDVQTEFRVFELAKANGLWDISLYRDAYNACLSITILPTVLWQWTRIDDPYVFKVFFQLLFAACPVLVFRLALRVTSKFVALIATIYFFSFVTFFQDMPMLNRQEVGFLFLLAALCSGSNPVVSVRARRLWLVVFGCGMIISHYSTTYVTLAVLGVAITARWGEHAAAELRRRIRRRAPAPAFPFSDRTLTPWVLAALLVVSFGWTTATATGGALTRTVSALVTTLRGDATSAKSQDTAYSLFSQSNVTPAQKLAAYRAASLSGTAAARAAGVYYGTAVLDRYATPVVIPPPLPITGAGRSLRSIGLDPAGLNSGLRQGSARLLQVFIALGLLASIFGRRTARVMDPEFRRLAVASMAIVLAQVILPVLSVDYGLLRAFQQALVFLGVFLVMGTILVCGRLGRRLMGPSVATLALVFMASATGVLTQIFGGYQPQLHLNNSGTYYDIYYIHPEEIAGVDWLRRNTTASTQRDVQSEIQTDRYTFTRLQTFSPVASLNDIFPPLVRRRSFVFLGYNNVRESESTAPIDGDLVTYRYPLNFLDNEKDRLYDNGGARVYH